MRARASCASECCCCYFANAICACAHRRPIVANDELIVWTLVALLPGASTAHAGHGGHGRLQLATCNSHQHHIAHCTLCAVCSLARPRRAHRSVRRARPSPCRNVSAHCCLAREAQLTHTCTPNGCNKKRPPRATQHRDVLTQTTIARVTYRTGRTQTANRKTALATIDCRRRRRCHAASTACKPRN